MIPHRLFVPRWSARLGMVVFLALGWWCFPALPLQAQATNNELGPQTKRLALLPAETTLNHSAGRGGWVILTVRLADGEELPMILDTGCPITVVDLSLRPKLGARLDLGSFNSYRGSQPCGIYAAPGLYLDQVPLEGGNNILAADLSRLIPPSKPRIVGILGMDYLCHYCVQLDFEAGKIRFLDSIHLSTAGLGQGFPLHFAADQEHFGIPIIQQAGLLGGAPTNAVIDTGNDSDGTTKGSAIRHHAAGSYTGDWVRRTKHFLAVEGLVKAGVLLPGCTWAGNTYTNIAVARGRGSLPNWIGIRFLARHLVTLDFPSQMLYLRQTSTGPLQ